MSKRKFASALFVIQVKCLRGNIIMVGNYTGALFFTEMVGSIPIIDFSAIHRKEKHFGGDLSTKVLLFCC